MRGRAKSRGALSLLALALTALVATLLAPGPAAAAEDLVLADFESADALDGATLPAPDLDSAKVTDTFASEGNASMQLDIGAFDSKAGLVFPRIWLNVGSTLPEVDWTQRRYLHVGMANASAERARLYVVVWDDDGRYLLRSQWAEPFEHRVFEVRTADIAAAGVDLSRLDKIQLSTERSPSPKRLYADDIRLTDNPTDVPAEQARVASALVGLMDLRGALTKASDALDMVRKRITPGPSGPDQSLIEQADALQQQLDTYADQIGSVADSVGEAREIWFGLTDIRWRVRRLSTLVDARRARPTAPVGLGFADSMSRVYPRDLPCDCDFTSPTLDMVRGEHESIQLVALPYTTPLAGARVQARIVDDRPGGLRVDAHPVVSLNMAPPVDQQPATPTAFRPSVYEGWTPDPIQTGRDSTDVAAGDLQSFWVAVEAARDTRPGVYPVELELRADGIAPQRVRMNVQVWDLSIAREPGLRTAIGHDPKAYAEPYGVTDPAEIAALVEEEYAFLGEYLLQGDNIYRSIYEANPPSVESLRRIEERSGGLRQFNIWYFDPRLFDLGAPETWAQQADALFDRIQPYVDQYRAAGFLDKAYLYCCDETRAEHTEVIRYVLTRFKERFPGVPVLTTTIDNQMGRVSGLDEVMDWWVRDVPWYDPEIIAERHADGREAWWYLHAGNTNPTPNVFINYDPGQLRTLLGPMIHQAGLDGFLYYRVDRWYGHGIVDDGPLSSWDPRTWNNRAGDGALLYPGPDGPIPSIRLENIRDGLEDYNLLDALRSAIDEAPADTDPKLLARAEHLLAASDVVTDNYAYEDEPDAYRHWRSEVAKTTAQLS
ncbi:DUF4091 domain-containing protein [Actinopolymorpha sp. B17G11]|uniref:DUF4091 domain-containing protein n=1 Tax=Actinopolymorpha sp. B17G11 TaxID=3160861 RepID=UPI0032E3A9E1